MTAYEDYNPTGYTTPEIIETDWARIAVLQTERAHIGRELVRNGNRTHYGDTALVRRYNAIDQAIKDALT
ncbi:MAG: hypothetical protein ABWY20_02385 [Mycobacterium sp.]